MDFGAILQVIVTNGIGGACAAAVLWFAYYRETVTIPKMVDAFTASSAAAQTYASDRSDKMLEAFTTLTREERQVYQSNHEENRERLDRLFAEMRELRHAVKDNQQTELRRKEVEEALRRQGEAKGTAAG